MTNGELLTCERVNKRYGGVHAVLDVSLTVGPGEIVGLVGPNGAGKTTLVDVITGQQQADDGRITIAGIALSGPPSRRARRAGFARTFQHPQLALDMTVRENLVVGAVGDQLGTVAGLLARVVGGTVRQIPAAVADQVEQVAARLQLGDIDRRAADLSLGEQRVVEVARAMLRSPQVLLLDEPFAGSDLHSVGSMTSALDQLVAHGCGVLLVDHNIDIVAGLVHRMVLMDQGAVAFTGTPEDALASDEMRRVYFGGQDG